MASLLASSSLGFLHYSAIQGQFILPCFSHPHPNRRPAVPPYSFSFSSSYFLLPVCAVANNPASFPYSQFQQGPCPRKEDPVEARKRGCPEERPLEDEDDDDLVIGDCLVFEEGAFQEEGSFHPSGDGRERKMTKKKMPKLTKTAVQAGSDSLVPERWKEVVEQINLTKKEKRKMAHQLRFGSRMERRKASHFPGMEEYLTFRDMKLSQLNPVVLDNPKSFRVEVVPKKPEEPSGGRVVPRNPRLAVYGETLQDITEFLNSEDYVPGEMKDDKKQKSRRKLFTTEEKTLLNKRIPNLADATSRKWLPLHALASSGEFYLLDLLLKHNVDINAKDQDGLTAIHKAILSKKQAITSYLLRNSADPFVRDMDGATLLHYAVHTASSQSIKILLLYNVDINLADNDGWTPLHLAVQTRRIDIVRLLLLKGADGTLKNQDGLRPLDLCLYCGHNVRTYEIIKLLKNFSIPKSHV
ncbi:hypothetical protein HPP92_001740 [Vanilla planifolia]|uniref:Ankyrin repeat domain-containing protein, chloroplastic n=1 Tax=Vanilla planifolia TaxID=51239 RepID=A0A835VDU6_VANPL|nr:hypothetical protein HPP92_001740 [Vanilla planifolia]